MSPCLSFCLAPLIPLSPFLCLPFFWIIFFGVNVGSLFDENLANASCEIIPRRPRLWQWLQMVVQVENSCARWQRRTKSKSAEDKMLDPKVFDSPGCRYDPETRPLLNVGHPPESPREKSRFVMAETHNHTPQGLRAGCHGRTETYGGVVHHESVGRRLG